MQKALRGKACVLLSMFLVTALIAGLFGGCAGGGGGATTAAATQAAATTTTAAATTTAATTTTTTKATETEKPKPAAGTPGSLPIVDEKITLRAFWPGNATVLRFIETYNDAVIWPIIEKETNIHIDFQHGNQEQFNLMINSGDLTDIIYGPNMDFHYPGGGDKAIADGVYLRLNEILDEWGVHYKNLIESTPMFRRDTRTDSGNIWGFSMVETRIQGGYTGLTVRMDWLEDLGMEKPVTYDDWYDMLTRFKNEKNASAPLLLPENLFPANGVLGSGYQVSNTFYQDKGVVKYGPIEPPFKDYITMLAKWYKDGLIDKDFNTRDSASRDQLIYTKQTGAWHDGFWRLNYNKIHAEDEDVFHQVAIENPVVKVGDKTHMRQFNHNVRGQWAAVSAKTKYPVEAVRWLDNLYSESNWLLTNYGVEGQGFNYVDGEPVLSDLILRNPDGLLIAEALNQYAMHSGPMWRQWDREWPGWYPDEIACEAIWNTSTPDMMIPMHLISPTAEESEVTVKVMNDVNTYVLETCMKYVMGLEDLGTFDAFVSKIKSMDIDSAIKNYQAALDRYYARK